MLELASPDAFKTQYLVHLSFNSTLQLVNCILLEMVLVKGTL